MADYVHAGGFERSWRPIRGGCSAANILVVAAALEDV